MTFDPGRRRGPRGVAGARARLELADLHRGDRRAFLRRHEREAAEAARGNAETKSTFVARLLPRAADTRNLRLAWDYLRSGDGQAPGLDRLRFDDLDDGEVWELVRTLSKAMQDDTYRPSPDRKHEIPKASGKGMRTLSIPSIIDRLVQRAVVQVLQLYLDQFFDDRSLGYRPHRSINTALGLAEELIGGNDNWVLVPEDLRDAFNHVPQQRLLDVIRRYIPDDEMMRLMERLVCTETGRGIRQGGNLSPLLLNAYLNHFLDRRWRRTHPDVPLLRWADDILILCRSRAEAQQSYQSLKHLLLPAGMRLKSTPEQAIHDLAAGGEADWLGFRLLKGTDGLETHLTEKSWRSLSEKLELDHEKDAAPLRAVDTILGWVSHMGPCYQTTDVPQAYARIGSLAHNLAFDEIPSLEEVCRCWHQAHLRWERCRRLIRDRADGGLAGGSACRHREPGGTPRTGRAS